MKAILFPGQGSQIVGMGLEFYNNFEIVKKIFSEADNRLGGMASCFDFEGLEIERYYHFHCLNDKAFFKILDEIGLKDQLNWKKTKMGFYNLMTSMLFLKQTVLKENFVKIWISYSFNIFKSYIFIIFRVRNFN